MISASRRSEWIVCSDFLEQNRQKMARWLTPGREDDEERDAAWLLPFFRYVAQLERAEYFLFLAYLSLLSNCCPFLVPRKRAAQENSYIKRNTARSEDDDFLSSSHNRLLFPLFYTHSPFFSVHRISSEIGLVERVRRSVRAVVSCDVFSVDPLGVKGSDKESDCRGPFDIIISTLCLEFASLTPDDYTTAVTNTASLLKPSAYLILQVSS